jgi:DHA2 family multidrug resistance protein-like MFS transporter
MALIPIEAIVVGVGVGVVFVRRQRRLADPLMDVRLFADRAFTTALLMLLVGSLVVGGIGFLFAQYLQLVKGFDPLPAGLWLIPDATAMMVSSLLAPVLARRIPAKYVIAGGLALSTEGLVLLSRVEVTSDLPIAIAGVVLLALGIAPTWVLGTDLILGVAPPERAGGAASLSETGTELGVALGVAAMGSVSTAVYHAKLGGQVLPAGLDAGTAAAAKDSVVGAVAAAAALPGDAGAALLAVGRAAFTDGIALTAAVSAPIVVLLGVLVVYLLPSAVPAVEEEEVDGPEQLAA